MKKLILIVLFFIISINSYSQIKFEKGYIIHNTGEKEVCLIRNKDWKDNPSRIRYKISENEKVKIATYNDIKEFGIGDFSKYMKFTIDIDRSSELINNLSKEYKPLFKKEVLFLKVLIEGKASLFEYIDGDIRRYFYSIDTQLLEQLVYKSYEKKGRVGKNEQYKQQLFNNLKCSNISINEVMKLNYKQKELINFFARFNQCKNSKTVNFKDEGKRDLFNLYVKFGLNSSSLLIQNISSSSRDINFDKKTSFSIGVETEFLLPFNKNKWGIIFQPTYQFYKTEQVGEVDYVVGGKIISTVNYKSIEIPLGVRYYIYLKDNSKIFISSSLIYDLVLNSGIMFDREDGSNFKTFEINPSYNMDFGIGYNYNKYSLEFRIQTNRNLLSNYAYWQTEYKSVSVTLSYNLF